MALAGRFGLAAVAHGDRGQRVGRAVGTGAVRHGQGIANVDPAARCRLERNRRGGVGTVVEDRRAGARRAHRERRRRRAEDPVDRAGAGIGRDRLDAGARARDGARAGREERRGLDGGPARSLGRRSGRRRRLSRRHGDGESRARGGNSDRGGDNRFRLAGTHCLNGRRCGDRGQRDGDGLTRARDRRGGD